MSRTKHRAALAALGALTLTIAGCGGDGDSSGSGDKGGVIVGTTDPISSLDPAGAYDHGSWTVINNMYQHVMGIPQGKTEPRPEVAKKCDFDDPKTYTCTLRGDQKFSNGHKVTSKDVKFSLDRLLGINDPNGPASIFENLKSTEATDAHTVVFHLKQPDGTFPSRLATGAGAIVDHQVFPKGKLLKDDKVVGSGPYELSKYVPKQQSSLKPNEHYGGDITLKNSQVVLQQFSSPSAMKQAIEKGSVDVLHRTLSATDTAQLRKEKSKGIKVVTGTGTEKRYIVFNTKNGPAKKKAVRQAAALLINRDTIAKKTYNGTVQPLYSMVGLGIPGHIDAFKDQYGSTPDKAKAAKLLKDAGITTPIKLQLWYTPSHYGPSSADEYTEIKRMLDKSGLFKVSVKSTEWTEFQHAYKKGSYQAYEIGWFPDFPDPDNDLAPFYGNNPFLYTGYENPKIKKLLTQEQGTEDMAKRKPAFKKIQKMAAEDVPVLPVWQGRLTAVTRSGVSGVKEALDPQYLRFDQLAKSD